MKVYLLGDQMIIDQGNGIVTIPHSKTRFNFIGINTQIFDIDTKKAYTALTANIQNEAGLAIGTQDIVLLYLCSLGAKSTERVGRRIWRGMAERESMVIDTGGQDVWRGNDAGVNGSKYLPLPSVTGERMEVVSSSIEDMPSGILTFTGNALNGETVTIGTKVYTFQTTLTNVDGNVQIGATVLDSIDNLTNAIYPDSLAGKGTAFASAMTAQPQKIIALRVGSDKIVFSTNTAALASTETLTNASFSAPTFAQKSGTAVVKIEYLDVDGYEQQEVLIMNGTTIVLTNYVDGIFVNDFYALLTAENETGKGYITIKKEGGVSAGIYNMLGVGQNKSLVPKRMVPRGKTLTLKGWDATEVQGKRVIYRIGCTASYGIRHNPVYHFTDNVYLKSSTSSQLMLNEIVPELSVLTISAWADQAGAEGSASWWGYLDDNI